LPKDDLDKFIQERINANPDFEKLLESAEVKRAIEKAEKGMNFLIGQVMRKLKAEGKLADPVMVRKILDEVIDELMRKRESTADSEKKN
jgi:Asp-tRNA(Asn)/Glu-tRNA(Gln) amidotransferase B subunit